MSTIFLTVDEHDSLSIATTIERLINMLDDMEPDPDLEPALGAAENHPTPGWHYTRKRSKEGAQDDWYKATSALGEDEPSLGTGARYHNGGQEHWTAGYDPRDGEREEENEHGGNITDEPHDDNELDDDRPGLAGLAEPDEPSRGTQYLAGGLWENNLQFDGSGNQEGRALLCRARTSPRRDPDSLTILWPGVARVGF